VILALVVLTLLVALGAAIALVVHLVSRKKK